MENIKVKFGKQLKIKRNNLNLSQEAFALKCNLDRTYIASVENGKRNISIINIEKICNALGCTISDFFEFKEVQ